MAWFGRRPVPASVRKDAGELTIDDFRQHPVWEFCLDEESVEGQTECTVRPSDRAGVLRPLFDGGVRADILFADGRSMPGAVWITLLEGSPPEPRVELWTDRPARDLIPDPLPSWDCVIYDECRRFQLDLPLPSLTGIDDAPRKISLVYKALRTNSSRMWPLTVRPALPIEGLPPTWQLRGWRRPTSAGSDGEGGWVC